jgi:hypothetical protein
MSHVLELTVNTCQWCRARLQTCPSRTSPASNHVSLPLHPDPPSHVLCSLPLNCRVTNSELLQFTSVANRPGQRWWRRGGSFCPCASVLQHVQSVPFELEVVCQSGVVRAECVRQVWEERNPLNPTAFFKGAKATSHLFASHEHAAADTPHIDHTHCTLTYKRL